MFKEDTMVFNGNVEITFNDPEFMEDREYMQEPFIFVRGVSSDGSIEDYGNYLLEQ